MGPGDVPGQLQIEWSGVSKPATVRTTSPLPAPRSAPPVLRLKWDFATTFPQPTPEAFEAGVISDDDAEPENVRASTVNTPASCSQSSMTLIRWRTPADAALTPQQAMHREPKRPGRGLQSCSSRNPAGWSVGGKHNSMSMKRCSARKPRTPSRRPCVHGMLASTSAPRPRPNRRRTSGSNAPARIYSRRRGRDVRGQSAFRPACPSPGRCRPPSPRRPSDRRRTVSPSGPAPTRYALSPSSTPKS